MATNSESSDRPPKEGETDELRKIFENSQATFDENPTKWLTLVRNKLFTMFRSPMKEEYLHEAFRWVSQLCISTGDCSWMTTSDKWTQDEAKMFSCIARLSLAEVHILLPLIQRHLSVGDEAEIIDGKVVDRSANKDDYDRFGTHLVILESIIKSLVRDQTDEEDDPIGSESRGLNPVTDAMPGEDLKSLLDRMREAMTCMCEYLEMVHRHWLEVIKDAQGEKLSSAQGALRIISVWLSEDPTHLESQCRRFLIDLMIKSILLDDKSTKNDLTILALHSICVDNDDLIDACKGVADFEQALEKYLKYVQKEQQKLNDRRSEKMFKLRCGLVSDLAKRIKAPR